MMTRKASLLMLLGGALLAAALHFCFYDTIHKSPVNLRPGMVVFWGAVLFMGSNILAFGYNLLKVLFSVRGLQDEQEVERIAEPALRGYIEDERILRFTQIPFFGGLGILVVGILLAIFR